MSSPPESGSSAAIRFASGVVVTEVLVPDRVEPDVPFTVTMTVEGPVQGLMARMSAWPPRVGSRQVAQGGLGAPPAEILPDSRVRTLEQPLWVGSSSVQWVLPAPWHAPQVLLTLELRDGDQRIKATAGPRREDGVAMVGLCDVAVHPTTIVATPMPTAPQLDGRLDEAGWAAARVYPMVGSLDGEPYDERPGFVRWAWDAQALYVGAEITDPDIWSEYTEHDQPLWKQEVFEVFVFGGATRRNYLELQVSPRGTTFDARFEEYRRGDEGWNGRWRAAVDLRGTLDERRDRDEGWSTELAIPWEELCEHTEVLCPPHAGQRLIVNAFRFERPRKRPPVGLAISPPRVPDFHAPENAAVLELEGL